jgi:hypothetical protein
MFLPGFLVYACSAPPFSHPEERWSVDIVRSKAATPSRFIAGTRTLKTFKGEMQ